MKKFILIFLCSIFCITTGLASKANSTPLEAELLLKKNRFASASKVEAELTLTALINFEDDILLFDASNQALPEGPVSLEKGDSLVLPLLLSVDEKALKNGYVSVKIKYPIKNKKEIQYKNLQLKAPIKVVEASELDALDLDLSQVPEIALEGQALQFPVTVQNLGTKSCEGIQLEVAEQSLHIGDLPAGKSKDITLDLGLVQKDLNLTFLLEYSQEGQTRTTEIQDVKIHLGFPFIHFQERK